MFDIIGKAKNAMGVVAIHEVVELIDRGWNPRSVR